LGANLLNSNSSRLGWSSLPPAAFNNDPKQVYQAIYDGIAWAAIIVNPNATSMLRSAISIGNTTYDPLGACQLIFIDSRDENNWYHIILPQITFFMQEAQSMVGQRWVRTVLQNASDPSVLRNMRLAPQALSPSIGFSQFNLRPFWPYTALPAVSIGLICMYPTRQLLYV
jgi:hypothetical protein